VKSCLVRGLMLWVCIASFPVSGLTFNYIDTGVVVGSDCVVPPLPQPACAVIDVLGSFNDVPDLIPGDWVGRLHGQIVAGVGSGTIHLDDVSANNNDLFGTFSAVILPPDLSGISSAIFDYVVTSGTGMFSGFTGFGHSMATVVTAPAEIGPQGPVFVAACPLVAPAYRSFCDAGTFTVPEPSSFVLCALGCLAFFAIAKCRPNRGWPKRTLRRH